MSKSWLAFPWFPAVVGLLVTAACEDGHRAQDPVWGKQACGHCAMLVGDRRHAGQLTDQQGNRLYFDDVGCLAAYVEERQPVIEGMWVVAPSGAWVDARSSHYSVGEKTPMDYGFTPSESGSARYPDLVAAVLRRRGGGSR